MRQASRAVRLVRLEKGGCDADGSHRTGLCRNGNHGFSGDDGGDRLDDDGLMAGRAADLRIALPYAAVLLCLAVPAGPAFAHLLWSPSVHPCGSAISAASLWAMPGRSIGFSRIGT